MSYKDPQLIWRIWDKENHKWLRSRSGRTTWEQRGHVTLVLKQLISQDVNVRSRFWPIRCKIEPATLEDLR